MSEAFVGEIRMFAGNFAPIGWAICDGRTIPISDSAALYALIGTTYGGDGQTTFGLPDLRGRAPIHKTANYPIGSNGGVETVTLTTSQIPAHTHTALASNVAGTSLAPESLLWANSPYRAYSDSSGPLVAMGSNAISSVGGSQPHDNMMPFLVVNFIICLAGLYPNGN